MSLTLFEDTLLSVADANVLNAGRSDWTTVSTSKKEEALREATKVLNNMVWIGYALTSTQSMSWPRKEFTYFDPNYNLDITVAESEVPRRLRLATANLALHYVKYPSAVGNYDASFEKIKLGPLELEDTKTNNTVPAVPQTGVLAEVEPLLINGLSTSWWRAN